MSKILGFGGYEIPTYGAGPRTGYSVENPTDFNPNSQYNTGIGDDWFKNQDKWKSVADGTYGSDTPGGDGWMYKGDDGKRYIIRQNLGLGGQAPTDQEVADGATGFDAMLQKNPYYNGGYTTTALHQNNEVVGYNGIPHDMYDKEGNYIESKLPQGMGHDKPWRDAAILAAVVASAGLAGYASAGAGAAGAGGGAGATGGAGAFEGYGVASGIGAEGGGAAAAGGGAAGSYGSGASGADMSAFYGDYGSTGGTYGGASGVTDLGGGVSMGADGSITSTGAGSVTGTPPPANPYYGSATSAAGTGGSGSTLSGMMGQSAFTAPGIGSVSYGDLLKLGMTAYGAYSGSQGQEQTTTSTKELPEWLQGPVYGQGGVVPASQSLMNQQLYGQSPGLLSGQMTQAQAKAKKKKEQEKAKRGLL